MTPPAPLIRWFEDLGIEDVPIVGGKGASLGEMTRALIPAGVRLPLGFAVTAEAYWRFVDENRLRPIVEETARLLATGELAEHSASDRIRAAFLAGELPVDVADAIVGAYRELGERLGEADPPVAIRSSATAEDLPSASFAGQQESYLGVAGSDALLKAVRKCYASLFTPRAIAYRDQHGFSHLDVALSAVVQQLVCWPAEAAGVMFTVDPESGNPDLMLIEAVRGSGEAIVQGTISPDAYDVFKPGLANFPAPIVSRTPGLRAEPQQANPPDSADVQSGRFVLHDEEILALARWGRLIEDHYGRAMDIEWAKDKATGELFVLQARPMTAPSTIGGPSLKSYSMPSPRAAPILTGLSVGTSVATGPVRIIVDPTSASVFQPGEILVAVATSPDLVPAMRKASAIVTETGGRTSHAAIVSRELGVPAVVGASRAMATLRDDQVVTVSCAEGSTGYIYGGAVPWTESAEPLDTLPTTATKIMINLAVPGAAARWWALPSDGVGLARIEFIVANQVRVHPMALLQPERISDPNERAEVERLTHGYDEPGDYFVEALAQGISSIAASQYPRPVLVRTSDFKTNEYARLLGGHAFEPREENPMLGWRGASRYYDPRYRPAFGLECRAIRHVREQVGLTNVAVMIPFCRTVLEADRVLAVMEEEGLVRGRDGLQVYLMCEIPSNVVLADEFARRFDGFSIGSNDLTQLVLGVDRDSADLRALFDEHDPAVKSLIREVIRRAHEQGATVGICGQAPSDYPEFAAFLVEAGIDSISVNPDSFARTKRIVAETEQRLGG